jgi:hypothetical protein
VVRRRADLLVGYRLARTGLAYRLQRRRLFGGTTVRYQPRDSADTGTPATTIRIAGQRSVACRGPGVRARMVRPKGLRDR